MVRQGARSHQVKVSSAFARRPSGNFATAVLCCNEGVLVTKAYHRHAARCPLEPPGLPPLVALIEMPRGIDRYIVFTKITLPASTRPFNVHVLLLRQRPRTWVALFQFGLICTFPDKKHSFLIWSALNFISTAVLYRSPSVRSGMRT